MTESERLLHYLSGRFDSLEKFEEKEHATIHEKLASIEAKVDSLRMTRARLYAVATTLGAVAGYLSKFI
jgi:hypothetical protein